MAFIATSRTEFPVRCYLCGQRFPNGRDLSRHEQADHPAGFQCNCGRTYATTYKLRNHSQRKGCEIYTLYSWELRRRASSVSRTTPPASRSTGPMFAPSELPRSEQLSTGISITERANIFQDHLRDRLRGQTRDRERSPHRGPERQRQRDLRPDTRADYRDDSETEETINAIFDATSGTRPHAPTDEDPYGGQGAGQARLARFQSATISGYSRPHRLMHAEQADRSRSRSCHRGPQ